MYKLYWENRCVIEFKLLVRRLHTENSDPSIYSAMRSMGLLAQTVLYNLLAIEVLMLFQLRYDMTVYENFILYGKLIPGYWMNWHTTQHYCTLPIDVRIHIFISCAYYACKLYC